MFVGLGVVELHAVGHDAELLGVLEVVQQGSALQEGLGRDTSQVEARPAEVSALTLLDKSHLHPELARPNRRYVPPVTATDYYQIELIRHLNLLSSQPLKF